MKKLRRNCSLKGKITKFEKHGCRNIVAMETSSNVNNKMLPDKFLEKLGWCLL